MSTASIRDVAATDLAAFELGVLASSLTGCFDLAAFALSSRHRNEISTKIVQLKAAVVNFPRSTSRATGYAGAPVSFALTSVSRLSVVLNKVDTFLPELDCAWFHDAALNAEEFAANSEGVVPWGELYYQEMRHHVPAIRGELHDAVIDGVLETDRQRLMYQLGRLLDEGMHDPEVSRHVFDIVDLDASNANPFQLLQTLWSTDSTPESMQQHIDQINRQSHIDYQLRTFPDGKPPLTPGREPECFANWINRVRASAESFGLNCEPTEPWDAVSPESAVRVAQQLIDTIRTALVARSTPECSSINAEVFAPTTLRSSHSGSANEICAANTPSITRLDSSVTDNLRSTESTPNRIECETANLPVQTCQRQNEGRIGGDERFGDWVFTNGYVRLKEHPAFELSGNLRELLRNLVRRPAQRGGLPNWILWSDLGEGWIEGVDLSRETMRVAIARLRDMLAENLQAVCPSDPIPSNGRGDRHLCYRLDDTLR